MKPRTLPVVIAGLLPVIGLVAVVGMSSLRGPEPTRVVPPTTVPLVVSTTPTTTRPAPWPDLLMANNKDVHAIKMALLIIKQYDAPRYRKMHRIPWLILDCANLCQKDEIAYTDREASTCTVYLSVARAYKDSEYVGIPERLWLASILVHEWTHCTPEGDNERPSLREQREFHNTWPYGSHRGRANARVEYDYSRLDREGNWK